MQRLTKRRERRGNFMEEKSDRKSKEYIKELDLYEKVKESNSQLHNATMQLHNANAQRDQLLQEKETLTKENNELKQKVKELNDQLDKNVGSTLTQIETLKKEIETCQQQLKEEKQTHENDLKNLWKNQYAELVDGRILKKIHNIMKEEEYEKIEKNKWLNSNKLIELVDKINVAIYNDGEPFWAVAEGKLTQENWQKLKEAKEELMKDEK